MNSLSEQTWEAQFLDSVLGMVHAPYGDFVALGNLSRASSDPHSLQKMIDFVSRSPDAQLAFADRFLLGEIDLEQLYRLPQNTLGHAYASHILNNQLKLLAISDIKDDHSYLIAHITQSHDIWHVLTDSDTSVAGEIQVQAFSVAQFVYSRLWLALLAKNIIKTAMIDLEECDRRMNALTKGWTMGKQAKPLFGIRWNQYWEHPLVEIRKRFNLPLHPGQVQLTLE